ncbi:gp16 family protein [Vibrio mediterranei]
MSKLIKLIHVAKRDLAISDDAYREILEQETGKRSAKGLSEKNLKRVIERMKALGFKVKRKTKRPLKPKANELSKVWAIWSLMHRQGFIKSGSEESLDAYVKRMTSRINGVGVDKAAWLDSYQATYVLESLKSWHGRVMIARFEAAGLTIPIVLGKVAPYHTLSNYYRERLEGRKRDE